MKIPVRSLIVPGLFVFLLTACNLQTGSEIEIVITEEPTAIIVTQEASPSPTAIIVTEEASAIPVSTPVDAEDNTCVTTNPDWHSYIVRAGDTLASIANASNSSVNTLASVNCIANINQISVGQVIRVPQLVTPTMPLIDMGAVPANVCGVEPLIPPIDIFGDGGTPFARLQGTILVTGRNDVGYFVDVPGFAFPGYVRANEVRELGSNCPEIPLPVINQAPPFVSSCMVVATNGRADIFRLGPAFAIASLIQAQYVRRADNAYIISTPSLGGESWVSATEATLSGAACPDNLSDLPVISSTGVIPASDCSVVLDELTARVGIKYGYADVYAPIAVLGNWLPYVNHLEDGYTVDISDWDITGWIDSENVHLEGTVCPDDDPLEHSCLEPYNSGNPVVITPSTVVEDDCVSIRTGVITVSYPDAPENFSMVEFWMQHESGNTDVIGTDTNPVDGASIQYTVHDSHPDSLVYAFVYGPGPNSSTESGQIAVYLSN